MRYRFAGYLFEAQRGLETAQGRIALRPRDERLLELLLEADGRNVSKDTIADALWSDGAASDDSIAQVVRRLRCAMPDGSGKKIVLTVYGVGFRLGVPVERLPEGGNGAGRARRRTEADACLVSAREAAVRRSVASLASAIEAARRAVELDPGYAGAWCALAEFRLIQAVRGTETPRSAGASAVAAAERALAIDPRCAPALAARGFVRATIEGDPGGGLLDLDRSIDIDPGYWLARGMRGWALLAAGRRGEAVKEVLAAAELNPWASWYSGMPAQYLFLAGEPAAALERARSSVQRFPDSDYAYFVLSQVASAMGLHDDAIVAGAAARDMARDTPLVHTSLACALALAGKAEKSLAAIAEIESAPGPLPSVWLALAWHALGRRDRAIAMLELAREQGAPQYVYALYDPRFAPLRQEGLLGGHSAAVPAVPVSA